MSAIKSQKFMSFSLRQVVPALLIALFLVVGAISTASAQEATKIGYVDLQAAVEQLNEGKQIRQRLEQEFSRRQGQLDQKQQEAMQLRTQLEQQAMMLSDEARQQRAMELQQKMIELQELYLTLQTELAQMEAEAMGGLLQKLEGVLAEIAKERNYSMILEKTESSILFADEKLDVTSELVRRYNAK